MQAINQRLPRWVLAVMLFLIAGLSLQSCNLTHHRKHQYMRKAFMAIQDSFPNAEVRMMRDSIKIIFPDDIMFHTAEADVLPGFMNNIAQFADFFQKFNKTNLLVTGYTDNTGEESFNDKLSEKRAENVKQKLVEYRIQPQRITTWGMGMKSPVASNKTPEGRARNRRVEFVILYDANL